MKKRNHVLVFFLLFVSFNLNGQIGSISSYYADLDSQSDNLSQGRTRFDVPVIEIPIGGKSIPITFSYTNVAPKYGILPGPLGHSWNFSFNYFVESKSLELEPMHLNYTTAHQIYDDANREGYDIKKFNLPFSSPSLLYSSGKPSYWLHTFPQEFDYSVTSNGIKYIIDASGWKYYLSTDNNNIINEGTYETIYIDKIVAPNKDTLSIEYGRTTLINPFKRLEKTINEPINVSIQMSDYYGSTYTDTIDFPNKTVVYPTKVKTSDGLEISFNYTITADKVLLSGVSSSMDKNVSISYITDQYASLIQSVSLSPIEGYQFTYEMPAAETSLFADCFNNYITGRSYIQGGEVKSMDMLNSFPMINDFYFVDTISMDGYPNFDFRVLNHKFSSYLKIEGDLSPGRILLSGDVVGGDIPANHAIFNIGSSSLPTFTAVPFQDYIVDGEGVLTIGTRTMWVATLSVGGGISIKFKTTSPDQSAVRTKILQYFSFIKLKGMKKGSHLMGGYEPADKSYFTFIPSKSLNDPTYYMLKEVILPTGGAVSYDYEPYEIEGGLRGPIATGEYTVGPDYRIKRKIFMDLNKDTLSMLKYSYGGVQQFPFDPDDPFCYDKNILSKYIQENYHIYPTYRREWAGLVPDRYTLSRSFRVTNVPAYVDEEEEYIQRQGFYHFNVTVEESDTKGIVGKDVYSFDIPGTIRREKNSIINYFYNPLGLQEFYRMDFPQWLSDITLGSVPRVKNELRYGFFNGQYVPVSKKEYTYNAGYELLNRNILNWQFNGSQANGDGLSTDRIIPDCGLNSSSGWELEASKTRIQYVPHVLRSVKTTVYNENQ